MNLYGAKGSPPRVRGKEGHRRDAAIRCGITPARAGKRLMYAAKKTTSGDHPRACGEKAVPTNSITWKKGSPPRVRGKDGIYADFAR